MTEERLTLGVMPAGIEDDNMMTQLECDICLLIEGIGDLKQIPPCQAKVCDVCIEVCSYEGQYYICLCPICKRGNPDGQRIALPENGFPIDRRRHDLMQRLSMQGATIPSLPNIIEGARDGDQLVNNLEALRGQADRFMTALATERRISQPVAVPGQTNFEEADSEPQQDLKTQFLQRCKEIRDQITSCVERVLQWIRENLSWSAIKAKLIRFFNRITGRDKKFSAQPQSQRSGSSSRRSSLTSNIQQPVDESSASSRRPSAESDIRIREIPEAEAV